VHNECVHQHVNANFEPPAHALVINTKPVLLFVNLLFQKTAGTRCSEPALGGKGFEARNLEDDYNHPK